MNKHCPCGTNKSYSLCCQPLHQRLAQAQTAKQLMMSRYCAFAQHHIDYIVDTHAPATRHEVVKNDISQWAKECQWLSLLIINDQCSGDHATVEFVAWYHSNNQLQFHHELSHFIYEDKQWFFHHGETPTKQIQLPKRNDSCIRNSGKKFKKCCG